MDLITKLRFNAEGAADAWDGAPLDLQNTLKSLSESLVEAADEIERLTKPQKGTRGDE